MSGNARTPPRSIAVVGDGPVAQLTAAALRAALPQATIDLVAEPVRADALADRFPVAVASAQPALALAGLNADMLVAAGVAIHRLGERFIGWGTPFRVVAAHDEPQLAGAMLHHLWLAHDTQASLASLTTADAMIEQRRFASTRDDDHLEVDPTLVFNADRLSDLLRNRAQRLRINRIAGVIRSVERDTAGDIAALRLDEDRVVCADLYIDTGGTLSRSSGEDWIDWRAMLPIAAYRCYRQPPTNSLETEWHNLPGSIAARLSTPSADLHLIGEMAGHATDAGAEDRIGIAPGRVVRPQQGNCIAIGDAAACVGPGGFWGFSLALRQIMLLLELLPARDAEPLMVEEFNRRAGDLIDSARDQASLLHQIHSGQVASASPRLTAALVQFEQRARLPYRGEDVATEADWTQMLLGLGMRPRRLDPIALSVPSDTARAALAARRDRAGRIAARLPDYASWLEQVGSRAPS